MRKIRVLIVDDAVVVRRMITNVLSEDAALEVVGIAANGRIGLDKIRQLNPDVVTLDIEMPVMDGLQTMKEIHRLHPRLPVIMFSTLTERGARASLDALSLGARDYVTKPANVGSVTAAMQCLRDDLIPKIKAQCPGIGVAAPAKPAKSASPSPVRQPLRKRPGTVARRQERIDIVAIGVSTGGPNALAEVIPQIPASLPVPVVMVQHMPPLFTRLLAERLNDQSSVRVHEGAENAKLEPGHIWIAPGGNHMALKKNISGVRLTLNQDPPENSCRPAVDVLFRSVAGNYGAHVLAVILTGMGQDGKLGCESVLQAGGQVIVQDEASSVVWGMPGAVAKADMADAILPLGRIAAEITQRVRKGRPAARSQHCGH
jgi:two-component system chemotaxis response regulator CheB